MTGPSEMCRHFHTAGPTFGVIGGRSTGTLGGGECLFNATAIVCMCVSQSHG